MSSISAPRHTPSWLGLLLWLGAAFAAAAIGVALQGENVAQQYAALPTPSWAPPSEVFGPVWTLLYILMGVAAWRVWRPAGFAGAPRALALFVLQLCLNAAWTPVFFGIGALSGALVLILALLAVLVVTVAAFARHDRLAAWLLAPYLGWVAFATALNAAIVAAV